MFSNSTEGEMFTRKWCERCRHAYDGYQLCDEAMEALFDDREPNFLLRVEPSRSDPTGVICTRIEAT